MNEIKLTPSPNGEDCLGNGQHEGVEIQCEECDYFLKCFPDSKAERSKSPMTPINQIQFSDDQHRQAYQMILRKMQKLDEYHESTAYLLALDSVCRDHQNQIFDFAEDLITLEALGCDWQTGTSLKTTRLIFNLWNGCCCDGEQYKDSDGYEVDLPSRNFVVDEIFSCSHAPYFWQAIKLRFPLYADEK